MIDYRSQRAKERITKAGIHIEQRGMGWRLTGAKDRAMTIADLSAVNRSDIDFLAGGRWSYENMGLEAGPRAGISCRA